MAHDIISRNYRTCDDKQNNIVNVCVITFQFLIICLSGGNSNRFKCQNKQSGSLVLNSNDLMICFREFVRLLQYGHLF